MRRCITLLILLAVGLAETSWAQGGTWEVTAIDTALHVRTLFVAADGTVFAGTDAGLLRGTELGGNWTLVLSLSDIPGPPVGIWDLAQFPDGALLAAGTNGVHRSMDAGMTWTTVLPQPIRDSCLGEAFLGFTFVLAAPSNEAFAASIEEEGGPCKTSGRLYRSENVGDEWSSKNASYPVTATISPVGTLWYSDISGQIISSEQGVLIADLDAPVVAFATSPTGSIFAGTGRPIGNKTGTGRGIYRSTDNGETWHPVNTGLTDTTITDLAVYPNGTLLAATLHGGVHRSTDGGDSWHPINTGLPSLTVTALAVTEEGFVFAGTDRGIYRSTRAIATAAEDEAALPEGFTLAPNHPNPFNPATTIRYALPEAAEVRLTVYDALGREVKRLVDGLRVAGEHEVVFEGQGLPSGVYMYRLTAGGVTQTRRMVLMK